MNTAIRDLLKNVFFVKKLLTIFAETFILIKQFKFCMGS